MRHFPRAIAGAMLMTTFAVGLGPLAGCAFKGDIAHKSAADRLDASDLWQPWPASIRVYPSSRFARVDQQLIVEARVELLDEMGDSTKGSGLVQVQLNTTGRASGKAQARPLYKWDIPLQSAQDQKTYYDPITRAYLFRLKMDQDAAPQSPTTLAVTFTRPNGQRLTAQATLPATR